MEYFMNLLKNVTDSYDDFVRGVISYVKIPGNEYKQNLIEEYIQDHPSSNTSDVTNYILEETDFWSEYKEKKVANYR
ncbi:MAG: hypothetical protein J6O73_01490 [Lachnospiraceae bacterium]|nr:hypothetical protein [Lachnospiraceae bacterium]